jgi:hypothetical protein
VDRRRAEARYPADDPRNVAASPPILTVALQAIMQPVCQRPAARRDAGPVDTYVVSFLFFTMIGRATVAAAIGTECDTFAAQSEAPRFNNIHNYLGNKALSLCLRTETRDCR